MTGYRQPRHAFGAWQFSHSNFALGPSNYEGVRGSRVLPPASRIPDPPPPGSGARPHMIYVLHSEEFLSKKL